MSKPPTTHYMRPYHLALAGESMFSESSKLCQHGRKQINVMLDYVFDFMLKYKRRGFMGLSFMSEYTHDPNSKREWVDDILVEYLEKFITSGLSKNTILIMFSDHGPRFSDVRASIRGLLEERNPFLSVFMPDLFKTRYPVEYDALTHNKDFLTSPFDVHATLADLLNMEARRKNIKANDIDIDSRANSLFRRMDQYRTCADAGIGSHWCSCLKRSELQVNSYTQQIAQDFVRFLNDDLLAPVKDICEELTLKQTSKIYLLEAQGSLTEKEKSKDRPIRTSLLQRFLNIFTGPSLLGSVKVTTHYEQYQLIVETMPNRALFEATIVIERDLSNSNNYVVKIDKNLISRINKYGNQSKCVHDRYPDLRKYCLCKK